MSRIPLTIAAAFTLAAFLVPPADAEPATVVFAPWGVQIAGSFTKAAALGAFARVQRAYPRVIGDMSPFVITSNLSSRGGQPFYRVRLPAQSEAEAKALCDRLVAAGGACLVLPTEAR
jgi:hypothetical protein